MKLTQPSFTGGEISPSLYSRVDLQRYGTSLKTLRNFIVSSYGGVYNRPGQRYIAHTRNDGVTRLISFEFSTVQTYAVQLSDFRARFIANGAQVVDGGGNPVEIVTPWAAADIWALRHSQSADVMWVTHPNYPPQVIQRTGASTFTIEEYDLKNGPFLPINGNSASLMATSGVLGSVNVTSNTPGTFDPAMVGQLVFLQNQNFSNLKYWTAGEKNVAIGTIRTNAGNTYEAIAVSTGGTYTLTGGNAPQHTTGAEWDGPGDVRSDGSTNYSVGIQWQYVDCGYGIVQLTSVASDISATGTVTLRLPAGVVGGAGSPARSWSFTGDGTTVTFAIAGNVSPNEANYGVTINADPIPSDPTYTPPTGGPVGGSGSGGGGGIGSAGKGIHPQ